MATHSSILAWEILRTEEPGELRSMGSQIEPLTCIHTHTHKLIGKYFLSILDIMNTRFSQYKFCNRKMHSVMPGTNSLWYLSKKVLDNIILFIKLWTMKYYYMINEYRLEMKELFLSKSLGLLKIKVKWDYNITRFVKNINILDTCKSIIWRILTPVCCKSETIKKWMCAWNWC